MMLRPSNEPSLPLPRRFQSLLVIALLLYWGALFVSTHTPMPILDELPTGSDKYLHFSAYAGLAFLLGARRATRRELALRDYMLIFLLTAGYGIVDELLQAIPVLHRTCDPLDWMADCMGSLCGLGLLTIVTSLYRRITAGYEAT